MNANLSAGGLTGSSKPIPTTVETLRLFGRLARLLRQYWGPLAKGICLTAILGLVAMVPPYLSKLMIDRMYPARDVGLLNALVIAAGVIALSTTVMGAIQSYYSQIVGAELSSATNLLFFNHVQHLPATFYDTHPVGEVLSRFGDARNALSAVTGAFQTILTNSIYLLVVPPFLFALHWKLTVLSLVVIPMTIALSTAASRITRRYYKAAAESGAELSAYQMEVLSHIRTLKSMALEPDVFGRVREETHRLLHLTLKASRVQTVVGAANGLVRALGAAVFTWYAWTLILRGDLTLGGFIAFSAYLGYLTGPITQLASLFISAQQTAVSVGRMFEYLDTPPEQPPSWAYSAAPAIVHRLRGEVQIRNVSFGYEPTRRVLNDVSASFRRGAVTAIVGPSGAGKSSLLRLIPRLVDPDSGSVVIDGSSVIDIPLADLRRQVAVAWQEISLLRGTILDNLTLRMNVPAVTVDAAVATCGLDELLSQLPKGLSTPVAEFGATLSGGQRQRIAIARALIRQAPILLLDEATANLDVKSEHALLGNLFSTYRDRTIIMVTHRIHATRDADHVYIMADGGIIAAGSPSVLATTDARYREMLGPSLGAVRPQHVHEA